MSGFLEKYNTDDVFLRGLILGLLRALNEKLTYTQVNDQQQVLEVFVPFFYSMSGDEAFLEDFFIQYENCDGDVPFAEGNYDVIPRGIVTMGNPQIDTAALTNPYVRATYTQEDIQGQMRAFSAYTKSIPLSVPFTIVIKIDSLLDSFKIFQSTLETFYKVLVFYFEYGGMKIPVQVGFPEGYDNDKQQEFSYLNGQKRIQFSFTVQAETYYPQKDLATERFRGNLMQAGIKAKTDLGLVGNSNNEEIL
jgi:uncharacterized protein YneR